MKKALVPLLFLLLLAAAFSCSEKREGITFAPEVGHPKNWIVDHGGTSLTPGSNCGECHGIDLLGGISGVSCFSANFNGVGCHPEGPGTGHPDNWGRPVAHGVAAKAAPSANTGFGSCQACHGRYYGGGVVLVSCFTCHGLEAPHPRNGWIGGGRDHTTTSRLNAIVCADCHLNKGSNSTPDCFNNTLCHGPRGVHPGGWGSPTRHGASAKDAPGRSSGFASCQDCHGADFGGGSVDVSCYTCHDLQAPHPRSGWAGGGRDHRSTQKDNGEVCGDCHRRPGVSGPSGCFNNTLCHGREAGHPPGWGDSSVHGATAKDRAGRNSGFASCQVCHGNNFKGGSVDVSCFPCHGLKAPHPDSGWVGGEDSHRSTDGSNAKICGDCHRRPGATGRSGCFNNTLCH